MNAEACDTRLTWFALFIQDIAKENSEMSFKGQSTLFIFFSSSRITCIILGCKRSLQVPRI
jgi:hypothetical protein